MPEMKFERDTQRFDCLGLDLNRPVDSVKPSKFPYLKNCRSFLAGRIEPRDGITKIDQVVSGQTGVHSCRRLNDPFDNTWKRIIGTGTHLALGQSTFTDIDSGYSGDPLALIPWRPKSSPEPFMYVADRSRMRKVTVESDLHTIGFPAPSGEPAVALNAPKYKVVDELNVTTGWTAGGDAAAPSQLDYRTDTTITYILYDAGSTGWACVVPASMVGIGPGCRLSIFDVGHTDDDTATVQSTFPGSAATTISRILYDSGSTGLCSMVLSTPVPQGFYDALIRNTTQSLNARIVSVHLGPDGTTSIRALTTGTWVAGDSVQILNSFRIYLNHTHPAGDTIRISNVRSVFTKSSGIATLTKTSALDLSTIATGVTAQPSDYMHISIAVTDPSAITEIKVLLDVDSSTNDFTKNYFWKSFRANDITPAATNTASLASTIQTVVSRQIMERPNATPEEVAAAAPPPVIDPATGEDVYQYADYTSVNPVTGLTFQQTVSFVNPQTGQPIDISQQISAGIGWVELIFPLSELIRVGSDQSRTLANVAAIRITAIISASVTLDASSWWIGGGYGPDASSPTATAYHYRYRARNILTNVPSNWSPPSRYLLTPIRQQIAVAPTQYTPPSGTTLAATDFVLDIERYGGEVTEWHYIGVTDNVSSPLFEDAMADDIAGAQPIIGMDNYQPWPVLGTPVSGTTSSVAGVAVHDSGSNFNTSWAPGTRIFINDTAFTIYSVPTTSLLWLTENAGSLGAVKWNIPEPTILAQPLPVLWEWDGTFFACGDPINPGRLYYSNPDSETTTPTNYLDLTSPSEPLMNGLQYNTRSYVFSSEAFIQILKTGNPNDPYRHEHIPNGKGLFSRWAVTLHPSPVICFGAKDGINLTVGGSPVALTDADLYELFPNEGNIGIAVNGINAPNIVSANATKLRLEYYDEYLYFDYLDTIGNPATLILAFDLGAAVRGEAPGGWFWDVYTPGVIMHYGEEGPGVHSLLVGTTGENLYQYAGFSDDGVAFSMEIGTPSRDQGDPRIEKFYGDQMIDCNLDGLSATATPYFDNNSRTGPGTTITNSTRTQIVIPLANLSNGSSWVTARNISLSLVTSISTAARPFFYIWESRWTFESAPLAAVSWEISPTTFGMDNFKHFGIVKVTHVSTVDPVLLFTVDGVLQPPITIPNSGGAYQQTIFRVPVMKGKLYKMRLASGDGITTFRLDTRDTFFEIKDWGSDGAYNKIRVFGDFSLVEGSAKIWTMFYLAGFAGILLYLMTVAACFGWAL